MWPRSFTAGPWASAVGSGTHVGMGGQLSDQGVCAAASTGGCYLFLVLQITSLPEWDEDGYHSSEFSILLVKLLSVSIM